MSIDAVHVWVTPRVLGQGIPLQDIRTALVERARSDGYELASSPLIIGVNPEGDLTIYAEIVKQIIRPNREEDA